MSRTTARPGPTAILGGGYGGALCAARLASHGVPVTLVDPSPVFQHRVRFHDLAGGTTLPDRPLGAWLGVHHVQARATKVRSGRVELSNGHVLDVENVVVAVGRSFAGPPGTIGLRTATEVRSLAERAQRGEAITVVGAGLTGVELAGALARKTRVTLVDRGRLQAFSPDVRRLLLKWFERAGVDYRPESAFEDLAPGEAVVWAGGPGAHCLPVEGAQTTADGRLRADPFLRLAPGIWGVGDAIAVDGQPWHTGGCALALPMGAQVADQICGQEVLPFSYRWSGKLVAFGSRAIFQGTDVHGSPTRCIAAGWGIGRLKLGLIATVLATIRAERRTGYRLFQWPRAPLPLADVRVA